MAHQADTRGDGTSPSRADRARAVLRGSPLVAGAVGAVLVVLMAALVTEVVLRASTDTTPDPAADPGTVCDGDGSCDVERNQLEETPATLPRAEVARRVATLLGLDAIQVDCTDDLTIAVTASVVCTVSVGPDIVWEAFVTVAGVDRGEVVLEVVGPDGELGRVVPGGPPTAAEKSWAEALHRLTLGEEPLYHDAATVDAVTLTAWAEAASGCAETLETAGSPGPRLAEAARRAGLGCHEMDVAAAAFETAAARWGSAESDVRLRVRGIEHGVDRWKYGRHLLEVASTFADDAVPANAPVG
jgi:hypothetical protein